MNELNIEKLKIVNFNEIPPEGLPEEIDKRPLLGQQAYMASRLALKISLEALGISDLSWNDLEIERHLFLKKHPEILVSLSHTQTFGAAYVALSSCFRSIGVDLELCGRKMKESTLKFFVNTDDEYSDTLKLWTQKEAAFKAISPLYQKQDLTLKMITIKGEKFFLKEDVCFKGQVSIQKMICDNEEFWIAKATLPH